MVNRTYVNDNSPANWGFAIALTDIMATVPDDAQFDLMQFIYGNGQ